MSQNSITTIQNESAWALLVFDLDGTVLNSNKAVSNRFRHAISSAINKGVRVAFASGRTLESVVDLTSGMPELSDDTYIIACNGALIWQNKDKSLIKSNVLDCNDISIINDFAYKINKPCYIVKNRLLFTPFDREFTSDADKYSTLQVNVSLMDWKNQTLTTPKMMFIASENEIDEIEQQITAPLKDHYHIVRSETNYLEVMKKDVNKGSACQFLIDYLGISASQVIAVGDEYNDVEMLKFAGLGVAMGNARQELKEIADWVTFSNDSDGAAFVIENWVLNR